MPSPPTVALPADRPLPVKKVAAMLGVVPRTVHRLCQDGLLAHHRVVRSDRKEALYLIYPHAVREFLDRSYGGPAVSFQPEVPDGDSR